MSKEVIQQFVERINAADIKGIVDLMSDDHTFIDNIGNVIVGKDTMKEGWEQYFAWFPDYHIEVSDMMQDGDTYLLCGTATATFKRLPNPEAHFSIPAAWKGEVESGKIKLWQVFADSKVQFDVVGRFTTNSA